MIGAHKVLAAYACLAPRVITGQFDPTRHRAIWPSTGNYARGGVAISRIMGCRGVAVLPAGMTPGALRLAGPVGRRPGRRRPHAGHREQREGDLRRLPRAGRGSRQLRPQPVRRVRQPPRPLRDHRASPRPRCSTHVRTGRRDLRLAAFVSATGSAGTIAAGDRLKDEHGTRIVAVEALECPTMLENGFGEHNIQGIGDKHIPLIHNVMNTDVVVRRQRPCHRRARRAVQHPRRAEPSCTHRKSLPARDGRRAPALRPLVDLQHHRRHQDGQAARPRSRRRGHHRRHRRRRAVPERAGQDDQSPLRRAFGALDAAEVFAEHLAAADTDAMIDCSARDRTRIFNLGYYTWVEQQGTPLEVFEARRSQAFWRGLRRYLPVWDELIDDFNARVRPPGERAGDWRRPTSSGPLRGLRHGGRHRHARALGAARGRRWTTVTTSCTSCAARPAAPSRRRRPVHRLRCRAGLAGVRPRQRADRGRDAGPS